MTKPDASQGTPDEESTSPTGAVTGETPAAEPTSATGVDEQAQNTTSTAADGTPEVHPVDSVLVVEDGTSYPAPPSHAPSLGYGESAEHEAAAESTGASAPVEETAQDKKPVRFALVGLAVGILVGFSFNYTLTGIQELVKNANSTVITAAVTDCNLDDKEGISVTDNGKKLSIDTKGTKDESGASSQNAVCLIQSLHVPQDVIQKLDATKTGAERQSTEWEKRELAWEFSADNGIQMEYVIKN